MSLKNKRVIIIMSRINIASATFPRPHLHPHTRTRVRMFCSGKDKWTPDEQKYINENKEWKWYLPEEDVWDLDSIREASQYRLESLELMLELMTPEEEKALSDMVEKLEQYAEKYVDENNN